MFLLRMNCEPLKLDAEKTNALRRSAPSVARRKAKLCERRLRRRASPRLSLDALRGWAHRKTEHRGTTAGRKPELIIFAIG